MPSLTGFVATLRQQRHPLRFLSGLILYRTGLCRYFRLRHADFTIPFGRYAHAMHLWCDPQVSADDFSFLRAYLRPGDHVIDVGANIGLLTLTGSKIVGEQGRVLAIEPHPRTHDALVANVAANGRANVRPVNVALGAETGTLRFEDRHDDDTANRVLSAGERGIDVAAVRLDDLVERERFAGTGPIALLKIDAEGYERMVLEGAVETLGRVRCVYFEAADWLTGRFGYPASDVFELLRRQGFSFLRTEGAGRVSHYDPTASTEYGNYVAVRDFTEFARRACPTVVESRSGAAAPAR